MSSKSTKCYDAVFNYIQTKLFDLQPASFITDFEAGMRKSLNKNFPSAILRGCWFHFKRAVKGKCNELGMNHLFKTNEKAAIFQGQLLNLPLLPSQSIVQGFVSIKRQVARCKLTKNFGKLFNYFETYWLNQVYNMCRMYFDFLLVHVIYTHLCM